MAEKIKKDDEEWRKQLTPNQYYVTRQKGTEPPFTGEHYDSHAKGTFVCVCCGQPLFSSETKFESGSGWPSFTAPVEAGERHALERCEPRDVAHRSALQPVRRALGPRVR